MSFYIDVIRKDPRFSSLQPIRDEALLEPVTRAAVLRIVAGALAQGIVLEVTETYRSQARQKMLFDRGATQLEHVGVHGYGLACDFCRLIGGGTADWDGADYAFLGPLAKANGMIWGGDWGEPGARHSFLDYDHVQSCTVAQQSALFAGTWYPGSVAAEVEV